MEDEEGDWVGGGVEDVVVRQLRLQREDSEFVGSGPAQISHVIA